MTDSFDTRALELLSMALDQPANEREIWVRAQEGIDKALLARVLELLAADAEAPDMIVTGGAGKDSIEAPIPEEIGAYRITGLIGQGGMGAVYKGERSAGDFDHAVAIKVIRPGVLSESLIDRFRLERQTLADLNHKHIARLFDGGDTDEGEPYIVMEFIDGEPITVWADNQNLSRDQRLGLYTEVCSAVQYAHQNLIVHRDITPSNILVTSEGDAKLIDFGIAKPHDPGSVDAGPVSLGSLSFTPGYAAPERSQGAAANTLSDIFSLGKILEALIKAQASDPDLTAIIAEATNKDPGRRYASVDALMEDLEAYRAGLAVSARNGGTGYRLSKFLGRRKLGVTAASVALIGLVTALGVTNFQYWRAEAALDHANARFEQARNLSKSMIFDVYDQIDQVPGTLNARKEMAAIVREYVGVLADDPNAPVDILLDSAVQSTRLSDLYGGLGVANFGDTETSYELILESEKSLRILLEREPDNVAAINQMLWTLRLKSNQQLTYQRDEDAAYDTNQEGLTLAERGLKLTETAEGSKIIDRFWNTRTDQLKILFYRDDYDEALRLLPIYRAELTAPGMTDKLRNYTSKQAYFAKLEGEALTDLSRWEEAIEPLQGAVRNYTEILKENPDRYYYLLQNMTVTGTLARAHIHTENGDEALRLAGEAIAIARTIESFDPADANGRGFVATQLDTLAEAQAVFGQTDEAIASVLEALEKRRSLVSEFPETTSHQNDLAGTLKNVGAVYLTASQITLSCTAFDESKEILDGLAADDNLTEYEVEKVIPDLDALTEEAGCE